MRMTRYILLLGLAGVSLDGRAQEKHCWQEAGSGGYTYRFVTNDPIQARFYTLPNGLTVILSPNKKEPRIAVRIAVRAGSNLDPKDHNGLAHYLEHLLFKGTDKYGTLNWAAEKPKLRQIEDLYEQYGSTTDPVKRKAIYAQIDRVSGEAARFSVANEYDRIMASLGARQTNAHTWFEETVYEENIPSNVLDKFFTVQAERFRYPVIRLFHTELEAVYEEKNISLDNDDNKLQETCYYHLFPTHNYGQQTTIGTIAHLKNPSIKAIRAYYDKYYVPNNMAIVMAGDFNPDQVIKLIDNKFAYMKPRDVAAYTPAPEEPLGKPVTKDIYGPGTERLQLNYRVGAAGTREALLAKMASLVLSNGEAGLFDLNLDKQQRVLHSGIDVAQYKDYGVFTINATPKQGQTPEQAKDLITEQIGRLKNGQFDSSLFSAIIANYKLQHMQAMESNDERVTEITDEFIINKGNKWDDHALLLDNLSKITKEELTTFSQNFFADNYVLLYKRAGTDTNVAKIEKPPITPVATNEDKASLFVESLFATSIAPIRPVWIDYKKDLNISNAGNAKVVHVPNKVNDIFWVAYRFDMGKLNNRYLPVAAEYLKYLGTDKYSAEEISRKFFNIACQYKVAVGDDQIIISLEGLRENFDTAVALLENLITTCKPDDAALQELEKSILQSRSNSKMDKDVIKAAQQSYAIYGPNNPFNYVLSDEELKALQAKDLISLLHSLTGYEHEICYYGPEDVEPLVSKLMQLHAIPAVWTTRPNAIKFDRTIQTKPTVIFTSYDAVQADIQWIRNLDQYKPQKEALVNLFNSYFGGGMGSVVNKTIREAKALAYSTYAEVATPTKKDDKFMMVAYVGCQADKLEESVKTMNTLLEKLPKISADYITTQQNLLQDIETGRIVQDEILSNYLTAKKKGIDHDIRREEYVQYQQLKLGNLSLYHQQQLSGKPFTYCVIASDKKIKVDDLKKYGELKILTLEQLFGF